jgi:hypothetical protein
MSSLRLIYPWTRDFEELLSSQRAMEVQKNKAHA